MSLHDFMAWRLIYHSVVCECVNALQFPIISIVSLHQPFLSLMGYFPYLVCHCHTVWDVYKWHVKCVMLNYYFVICNYKNLETMSKVCVATLTTIFCQIKWKQIVIKALNIMDRNARTIIDMFFNESFIENVISITT